LFGSLTTMLCTAPFAALKSRRCVTADTPPPNRTHRSRRSGPTTVLSSRSRGSQTFTPCWGTIPGILSATHPRRYRPLRPTRCGVQMLSHPPQDSVAQGFKIACRTAGFSDLTDACCRVGMRCGLGRVNELALQVQNPRRLFASATQPACTLTLQPPPTALKAAHHDWDKRRQLPTSPTPSAESHGFSAARR